LPGLFLITRLDRENRREGEPEKPKAAISSQDVFAMSISKYLGASAKAENDNAARQLALQEHQLALEESGR
jgi:hypothetical protein